MKLSSHPGKTICQICRIDCGTTKERIVHATLDHPAGSVPQRFATCPACITDTFLGTTCSCGRPQAAVGAAYGSDS